MPREASKCKDWEKGRRERLKKNFEDLAKVLPSYDPSITISKIDILKEARVTILELKEEINIVTSSKEENKTFKDDLLKKLQDRIKKLLVRNEQLTNLFKDVGIKPPRVVGLVKKFRKPGVWSNKITQNVNGLQKKETEKENVSTTNSQNKSKIIKLASVNKAKCSKISNASRIQKPKKGGKKKVPLLNDVVIVSQIPTAPTINHQLLFVPNAPLQNISRGSTVLTVSPTKQVKSKKQATGPVNLGTSLGAGTLIFKNGNIISLLPQPQIMIPPPQTLLVSQVIKNKANLKTTNNNPFIRPINCITNTTQINKVPIPALTSKYANTSLILNNPVKTNKKIITKNKGVKRKCDDDDNGAKFKISKINNKSKEEKTNNDIKEKPTEVVTESIPVLKSNKTIKSTVEKDPHQNLKDEISETDLANNKDLKKPVESVSKDITSTFSKENEDTLNLVHSDLSNDIFASLQVPPGCQNTESTSPTAAFLLAFPLVSSMKVSEVIDEDNSNSQRETSTLLQIGSMDNSKPNDNLLNLDSFPFFTNYYNSKLDTIKEKLDQPEVNSKIDYNNTSQTLMETISRNDTVQCKENIKKLETPSEKTVLSSIISNSSHNITEQNMLKQINVFPEKLPLSNIDTSFIPSENTILTSNNHNLSDKKPQINKEVDAKLSSKKLQTSSINTNFNALENTTATSNNYTVSKSVQAHTIKTVDTRGNISNRMNVSSGTLQTSRVTTNCTPSENTIPTSNDYNLSQNMQTQISKEVNTRANISNHLNLFPDKLQTSSMNSNLTPSKNTIPTSNNYNNIQAQVSQKVHTKENISNQVNVSSEKLQTSNMSSNVSATSNYNLSKNIQTQLSRGVDKGGNITCEMNLSFEKLQASNIFTNFTPPEKTILTSNDCNLSNIKPQINKEVDTKLLSSKKLKTSSINTNFTPLENTIATSNNYNLCKNMLDHMDKTVDEKGNISNQINVTLQTSSINTNFTPSDNIIPTSNYYNLSQNMQAQKSKENHTSANTSNQLNLSPEKFKTSNINTNSTSSKNTIPTSNNYNVCNNFHAQINKEVYTKENVSNQINLSSEKSNMSTNFIPENTIANSNYNLSNNIQSQSSKRVDKGGKMAYQMNLPFEKLQSSYINTNLNPSDNTMQTSNNYNLSKNIQTQTNNEVDTRQNISNQINLNHEKLQTSNTITNFTPLENTIPISNTYNLSTNFQAQRKKEVDSGENLSNIINLHTQNIQTSNVNTNFLPPESTPLASNIYNLSNQPPINNELGKSNRINVPNEKCISSKNTVHNSNNYNLLSKGDAIRETISNKINEKLQTTSKFTPSKNIPTSNNYNVSNIQLQINKQSDLSENILNYEKLQSNNFVSPNSYNLSNIQSQTSKGIDTKSNISQTTSNISYNLSSNIQHSINKGVDTRENILNGITTSNVNRHFAPLENTVLTSKNYHLSQSNSRENISNPILILNDKISNNNANYNLSNIQPQRNKPVDTRKTITNQINPPNEKLQSNINTNFIPSQNSYNLSNIQPHISKGIDTSHQISEKLQTTCNINNNYNLSNIQVSKQDDVSNHQFLFKNSNNDIVTSKELLYSNKGSDINPNCNKNNKYQYNPFEVTKNAVDNSKDISKSADAKPPCYFTSNYNPCTYENQRNYSNPFYTNCNYSYNYSDTNINTKPCYSLNYENYQEYKKTDTFCNKKTKNQNKTVNWMTEQKSQTDCFLPSFTNQSYSFTSCISTDTSDINEAKKSTERFSWSPTKLPNFLEPTHNFITPTLPTLVGDLALGTSLPYKESKKKTCDNFLSVSQLVNQNNTPTRSKSKNIATKTKKSDKNDYDHKNRNKNVLSNYSAEALIGSQDGKKYADTSKSFLTDIVPYFTTVDDGYINQNTYTFQNNTYPSNNFIYTTPSISSSYLTGNLETSHDYSTENKNCINKNHHKEDKNLNYSNNIKKTKKANQNDYPILPIQNTNAPTPDDSQSHSTFLPYGCKNSLYQKQGTDFNAALLPLPKNTQHPQVSPSLNTVGTSLTNFNLSTIFPEINKGNIPNSSKSKSNTSYLEVPFNTDPKYGYPG